MFLSRLFLVSMAAALAGCPGPTPPECTSAAECGDALPVCLEGACVACQPGSSLSCYGGASGTEGVGACHAGTRTCAADGSEYGACTGEVIPHAESCANTADDDCDGAVNDGCLCQPGSTRSCYSGPEGTAGVGVCRAGTQTCNAAGTDFGACDGEVLPSAENCSDAMDDDCSGAPNDAAACVCSPGSVRSCYSGPTGTAGVGICQAGSETCNAEGTGYGACTGEVLPAVENCNDSQDDDCSGAPNDAASCVCAPGEVTSCYSGPQGTDQVGLCTAGQKTCNSAGTAYGACEGEVVPGPEVCGNFADDDCNGTPDDSLDEDGDGWAVCDGDCCDRAADGCAVPTEVNPGAFDFAGDGVDENCDGTADNGNGTCDEGLASNSANAVDFARALDACVTTTAVAPAPTRTWGVISAALTLPTGTGSPHASAKSIRPAFGAISPQAGAAMAVLSTGHAAATGQTNPAFSSFQSTDLGIGSSAPQDWLQANGGNVPNSPGCPMPNGTIRDPVMLTLQVRVPTNARSLSLRSFFLSSEFPEWVCSPFNDFFVVLLDSQAQSNPSDKNLAVYTSPTSTRYPMGVNLAYGNTGLFTACMNGNTGCESGTTAGTISTCSSPAPLAGTGFDVATAGKCNPDSLLGGGTGWLNLQGNVVPGETITLRVAIWDSGDGTFDSLVLLDALTWGRSSVIPGTGQ